MEDGTGNFSLIEGWLARQLNNLLEEPIKEDLFRYQRYRWLYVPLMSGFVLI